MQAKGARQQFRRAHVEAARRLYAQARGWQAVNETLYAAFEKYPGHQDVPVNQFKVTLVNRLYSAGVRAARIPT